MRRPLVQRDREQWPDKCDREDRRAFPEHDEHQRRGRHERKRHDGRAHVCAHQLQIRLAAAECDRRGDQDDVDDVVGSGCKHDPRDDGADALAVDGSDQRTCCQSDEREHRDVEGDSLQRSMLSELDDGRSREQKESAGRPTEQDDCSNREDERQREHASAGLGVDRHGEAFRKSRGGGERGEADQRAPAVRRRREDVPGRDQDTEASQTDWKDESGKPAGCDRLRAHVRLRTS